MKPQLTPWLQVEISSVCQAGCLDCNRQRPIDGYENTDLRNDIEWVLNQHLRQHSDLYDPQAWHQHIGQWPSLTYVQFCGNMGDPMAHPCIADCVQSVLDHHPQCVIDISTNGALGRLDQWDRLAKMNCSVTFAVDGLDDTNHIYRRGVEWSRVKLRMERFIQQGGTAWWQWINFPWNKHQQQQARQLAEQWGFQSFAVSNRFTPTQTFDNQIINNHSKPVSKQYHRPPRYSESELKQQQHDQVVALWQQYDQIQPRCVNQDDSKPYHHPSIHINSDGTVWPCCYMANVPFHVKQHTQWWYQQSVKDLPNNWNSLFHHTIDEIVGSEWWQHRLPQSWHRQHSESHTASSICLIHCGKCR